MHIFGKYLAYVLHMFCMFFLILCIFFAFFAYFLVAGPPAKPVWWPYTTLQVFSVFAIKGSSKSLQQSQYSLIALAG